MGGLFIGLCSVTVGLGTGAVLNPSLFQSDCKERSKPFHPVTHLDLGARLYLFCSSNKTPISLPAKGNKAPICGI